MITGFSISASFFTSVNFIFFLSSTGFLLPVLLDITMFFHIEKQVTNADNTTATKTLKDIIWISGIFFPLLDKTWQYMLGIPDMA